MAARTIRRESINLRPSRHWHRVINALNGTSAAEAAETAVGGQRSSNWIRRPNWAMGVLVFVLGYDDGVSDLLVPGFHVTGGGYGAQKLRGQVTLSGAREYTIYDHFLSNPITNGEHTLAILHPEFPTVPSFVAYDPYTGTTDRMQHRTSLPRWLRWVVQTVGTVTDMDFSLWVRWLEGHTPTGPIQD